MRTEEQKLKQKEWRKNNPDKWKAIKLRSKIRNEHKQRYGHIMPPWAEIDVIGDLYVAARELRELGFNLQIDHIVPVRGELVCGLHCKDNLRMLPAKENNLKGNIHN